MTQTLISVAGPTSAELIERKSRFIAQVFPVDDEKNAYMQLDLIRNAHRNANHHVYAWLIGKDHQFMRSSDDGEPTGTAGRPLLELIKKADLQDIMIVVTRYFGGVLLGTGGLVRAYTKAAQAAIDGARKVQKIPAAQYALLFDYSFIGKIEAYLTAEDIPVTEKTYGENVCFICLMDIDSRVAHQTVLAEISKGTLGFEDLGEKTFIEKPID